MPTKKQLPQIENRCYTMTVRQYSRENPALYGRRSSVLMCPVRDISSLAPCLHEEADTRLFADALTTKRANEKIISRTVDADVVVLVIPMVQQLGVDEL